MACVKAFVASSSAARIELSTSGRRAALFACSALAPSRLRGDRLRCSSSSEHGGGHDGVPGGGGYGGVPGAVAIVGYGVGAGYLSQKCPGHVVERLFSCVQIGT
eukprot:2530791-Pyramimonas_sp.AAC.1